MARLAFLSPWPPQPSGIASCAADVVPRLAAAGHAVDVLVDEALRPVSRGPDGPPQPGEIRTLGAHDLVWRLARGQYDLPVYQLGNSWAHGFTWPYLFRYPGLTVLHDARLHHARATTLMARRRHADYRAEFRYNHPDIQADAAELAITGFDGAYYFHWPMRRAVIDASRVVACHSMGMTRRLRALHPDRVVAYLPLGHGRARPAAALAEARTRFRQAHGIPDTALLFGVLGAAAVERRVAPVIRAFAAVRQWAPDARLLFAGSVDPLLPLDDLLDTFGVRAATHVVGRLDDDAFDDAAAACDVGLNLRWPTSREMSGPWLRLLAAGLPTVIVDSVHHSDIVTLDPRTWRCHAPAPTLESNPERHAVAVAVDILDEDHSLRLALRRLVVDGAFRQQLGDAARAHWEAHHTIDRMVDGYQALIEQALATPAPAASLPAHLRPDPSKYANALVRDIVGRPVL